MSGDENSGQAQIAWVQRHSPVLDEFVRGKLSDGALKGVKVAVVVHLEAKTAFLATILADAGADVVIAGSNPRTTNGAVVEALRGRGLDVVSEASGTHETWEQELLAAADREPELVIDDGAELTLRMAKFRPNLFQKLRGVSEETTTGTARLRSMHAEGQLPFGALTANDARCKMLFDNRFGTGQTTIQAFLRLTNRQIGGARFVVIGYGAVGRGIAQYARALGAVTGVVETDPVRALEAHMDGHEVGPTSAVLPGATAVITATGGIRAIGAAELEFLTDDVVLANAGHHDLEIDVDALAARASSEGPARTGITTYRVDDRDIHVLTNGALVNIAGGSGHPIEIMDLTFAVQGLGAHYLATNTLTPGVHVLPKELDDAIAAAKLRSLGIVLDDVKPDQYDDIREWTDGGSQG